LIISAGAIMTVFTELLALPMAKLFGNSNSQMIEITTNGIRIYGLSFLICGINMFASAFFTALNNGLISAIISFARTLLFQTATIVVLPIWFGINGVWLSVVVAEVLALIVTFVCFVANKKKYQY
jgi:Na+-driven multidrug efflux pump